MRRSPFCRDWLLGPGLLFRLHLLGGIGDVDIYAVICFDVGFHCLQLWLGVLLRCWLHGLI